MQDPNRAVGAETRKSYSGGTRDGFVDRQLSGDSILEVGFKSYFGVVQRIA
jgi:hypothetical protein